MLNKIRLYITQHNMLSMGDGIVIGLSGGADSICLFHVLLELSKEYNLALYVVHVNHGIRGTSADKDQAFVEELCNKHKIPYSIVKKDVPGIAAKKGISEEEAGRNVRYEAFHSFLDENKCNKIAVAHNKNDNAETFLFNLFRGSGITGLAGIPPTRGPIIRPLLCVERLEIEEYTKSRRLPYIIDATNLANDYSRNKIRNKILTYAKDEINNGVIEHISRSAKMLEEIESFIKDNVERVFNKIVIEEKNEGYRINIDDFNKLDIVIQKELLRKVIKTLSNKLKNIDLSHIQMILDLTSKQVRKEIHLPYDIIAIKGYNDIVIKKYKQDRKEINSKKLDPLEIQIPHSVQIPGTNQIITTSLKAYKNDMSIPKKGYTKWFDYDKIDNTILLRTRLEGDFLQINNKGSRKTIKALFIDEKVPKEIRDQIPLLADGSHIIWVVGGRISEAYKINENTNTILEISINGGKNDK